MLYRIPAEGIPEEDEMTRHRGFAPAEWVLSRLPRNPGGDILASRVPVYGTKDAGRGLWLGLKNTCKQFNFSLNQILPSLFSLRDDESRIIAVMSSNVDDLLCGYLPEGAKAMNSVLQQFFVGQEEHVTSGFAEKGFDTMKTLAFMSQPKTTLRELDQSLTTRNTV